MKWGHTMQHIQRLMSRLSEVCELWVRTAEQRRKEADSETDKVWSARQYGMADTYDEATQHLHDLLERLKQDTSAPIDWSGVLKLWARLAAHAYQIAQTDDNRMVVSYRQAGGEAYERAAAELRALLVEEEVELPE